MNRNALLGWFASLGRLLLIGLIGAMAALLGTAAWLWWRGRLVDPASLSTPYFYVAMAILVVGGFFVAGGTAQGFAGTDRMRNVFGGVVPDHLQTRRDQMQSWPSGVYLITTGLWCLLVLYLIDRM